ncbi:MAG TPA: toll/interleukin-1 receptor domain-containing protein [Pyrinomonadaceae bacterium]|nr:toll/interleukin-1 receptor domain-containing protein [Pyrinomonadaceae bacterium]
MPERTTSRKAGKAAAKWSARKAVASKVGRRPAESSAYTVFISHSSKERWIAGQISKEIKALGAETWLDLKDLHGGDEIRRSIKRGIRASNEAVVLLSSHSITSQWVVYEVGIADALGKRITPVLNNLSPDIGLAPLQGVKGIDLNDLDDFLVELAGRIRRRLGKTRKEVV